MGQVLGRTVKAQAIRRERWADTLERFGLSHGKTWAYEEIMEGRNEDGSTLVSRIRNRSRELRRLLKFSRTKQP